MFEFNRIVLQEISELNAGFLESLRFFDKMKVSYLLILLWLKNRIIK